MITPQPLKLNVTPVTKCECDQLDDGHECWWCRDAPLREAQSYFVDRIDDLIEYCEDADTKKDLRKLRALVKQYKSI